MKNFIVAALLVAASGFAFAQYPSKPIRFIVGFPPGGSADPTTRIIGQALSEQMGQPVVVENRPGGDSAIAAEAVSKMTPDGYTIMFASNSGMTAAVALRKQPLYDPLKDFTPISLVGRATQIFYVHPAVPARTLKEFIAYAKANPGKLNYGTGNPLSILYNVQLMKATGIDMVHVPYKGEGPLNPDIIAGRVQSAFLSTASAISLAKEGKLRPLAVLLERRSPLLPEVPTIDEAGVPEVTARQWAGVFGPPNMPREIVERLNKEVNAALKRPDVLERLQTYGYAAQGSTPERLLEINRADLELWRRLVKEAAIPLE
jgi:tripartite-type tricarboxylate transporter receptor subunit TctC